MSELRAHYVLSTHWDREWYQHFQDYRYRLVQLIDGVLEGWRTGRLRGPFQTDGQVVLIEDYLEIRPERWGEIRRRAEEGLLVMGPWYVLPDEFLVSGEALIRNLRLGCRTARQLGGKPSCAGFVCDEFGHNSQMPQIFKGFGLSGAFVWRGTNLPRQRLFTWRGADGSALLAYRFGWHGYCDYARRVRACHRKNLPFHAEQARLELQSLLEDEAACTPAHTLLLFDGGDHMGWDVEAYEVLCERMDALDGRFEIAHTSLDAYLEEIIAEAPRVDHVLEGELREPALYPTEIDNQWLTPGVLSSRVWIKQANARCQGLLCQWAEPFSALASWALEREYPQGFLQAAWKALLQNHPHDSISGCSIDAVHEDMKYRFAQCETIARRLAREALAPITASVAGDVGEHELRVGVFNPLPVPLEQPLDLVLEIPSDWPAYHEMEVFEPRPAFRIYSVEGRELPYQFIGQKPGCRRLRTYPAGFPQPHTVSEVRVGLQLAVPALGYTTLTVRAGQKDIPTRHPSTPGLASSERSLENEFLRVTVESNGSLTVLDKRSGQVYERWLTFEDCADIGDGWNFGLASGDQRFTSACSSASAGLGCDGPLVAALRIRSVMDLPDAFDFTAMTRSQKFERLVIDSTLTLRAGQARLEVETVVHNTLCDHRLRVLFPSGAEKARSYLSDSPFDVVERPIALRADNHLYREPEIEMKPQQTWSAVYDGQRGLAVIASGLLEAALVDQPERTLALTLFRATGRTVYTNGEPGGQLLGDLHFRYWVTPLAQEPQRAELCRLGVLLESGWQTTQAAPADQYLFRAGRVLPGEGGLLQLRGDALLSAVQQVEGALEVRLWNPNTHPVSARLHFTMPGQKHISQAQRVDFESRPLGESVPVEGGWLDFDLDPKQIVTWRCV